MPPWEIADSTSPDSALWFLRFVAYREAEAKAAKQARGKRGSY